jgi:hypothetical protein
MRKALFGLAAFLAVAFFVPAEAAPPNRIFEVCHGESRDGCDIRHTHWTTFEECSPKNGAKGADPAKSCINLGGQKLGEGCEVSSNHFPMRFGYCGYSWFEVRCYGGRPVASSVVCHG